MRQISQPKIWMVIVRDGRYQCGNDPRHDEDFRPHVWHARTWGECPFDVDAACFVVLDCEVEHGSFDLGADGGAAISHFEIVLKAGIVSTDSFFVATYDCCVFGDSGEPELLGLLGLLGLDWHCSCSIIDY